MSCFTVPMAEAALVTLTTIALEYRAAKQSKDLHEAVSASEKKPFYQKLKELATWLWVTTGALIIDHIMNGELMLSYPFFTAAQTPEGIETMMHEIATIGVSMSAFITLAWALKMMFDDYKVRKEIPASVKIHN